LKFVENLNRLFTPPLAIWTFHLLHQDTSQLVEDSDSAKALFKALRGQIPADAEEILFKAAHLESHQLQYQKATQRLADRATHAQLSKEVMKVKHLADEKHKSIGILQSL